MKNFSQILLISAIVLFLALIVWFFSEIVFFILVALVLSMIGQPMVNWLTSLHIGKIKIPVSVSALITLTVILGIFCLFFVFLIPVLVNEAKVISTIDIDTISQIYQEPIRQFENFLKSYNIITSDQTLEALASEKIMKLLQIIDFSDFFSGLLSFAGSFLISVFAILFITFFFLKDLHMFNSVLLLLTPDSYHAELEHILQSSRKMLSRYFLGLLLEIIIMTLLLWIGLSVIGVKNSLLIGFIGGGMVIIPYIGFIIGGVIGLVFGVTAALSANIQADVFQIAMQILIVYGIVKLIDDFILQPIIYSNSVKAHPLEIFLVILMAGSIAGIMGMILAIPAYTFLRIVAKVFLSQLKFVQKLTEKL